MDESLFYIAGGALIVVALILSFIGMRSDKFPSGNALTAGIVVMFLLVAAFAAVRMSGRRKLLGLGLGLALVFMLNQARILALFYAFRNERALFDTLHTTVLPAVLIAVVALYFHVVLQRDRLA